MSFRSLQSFSCCLRADFEIGWNNLKNRKESQVINNNKSHFTCFQPLTVRSVQKRYKLCCSEPHSPFREPHGVVLNLFFDMFSRRSPMNLVSAEHRAQNCVPCPTSSCCRSLVPKLGIVRCCGTQSFSFCNIWTFIIIYNLILLSITHIIST